MAPVTTEPVRPPVRRAARRETSPRARAAASRTTRARRAALACLVLLALGLRAHHLGWPPLWVDEAESAINGLTIVAEGRPVYRHLGLPLYENTLARPWPESVEYEFRDVSYSDRGLAVYHGWIPLYAIAGAFRLAGVTPDEARRTTPPREATTRELALWTAVPRLPALVFSALFVCAAFLLGKATAGDNAGFALAFAAACGNAFVWWGRQARYYSPTLAGNAACGFLVWRAATRGRLLDHILTGFGVGVLFHVHSLSAVTIAALYAAVLPLAMRQPRLWLRVLAAGFVAALLIVPWALWSGLAGHTAHVPPAWRYLDLGLLLATVPTTSPVLLGTVVLGLGWLALAAFGRRLPERWRRPVLDEERAILFALVWAVLAYALWVALIPAASYFVGRLRLALAVPGLLLLTLLLCAAARLLRPASALLPAAALAVVLALSGQLPPRLSDAPDEQFSAFVQRLRSLPLGERGRLLATPNSHLQLTYYTGRPVQSVAALRRQWLDGFEGPLVVVESVAHESLPPEAVTAVARRLGWPLSPEEARQRGLDAAWVARADELAREGIVTRLARPTDALDRALLPETRERTRRAVAEELRAVPLPRRSAANWSEFWHAFFFWFSRPEQRVGRGLNYSRCRASGHAEVEAIGFTLIRCQGKDAASAVPETER